MNGPNDPEDLSACDPVPANDERSTTDVLLVGAQVRGVDAQLVATAGIGGTGGADAGDDAGDGDAVRGDEAAMAIRRREAPVAGSR